MNRSQPHGRGRRPALLVLVCLGALAGCGDDPAIEEPAAAASTTTSTTAVSSSAPMPPPTSSTPIAVPTSVVATEPTVASVPAPTTSVFATQAPVGAFAVQPLVIADGTRITHIEFGEGAQTAVLHDMLTTVGVVADVRMPPLGPVIVQELDIEVDGAVSDVVSYTRDGPRQVVAEGHVLFDLADIDGVRSVLIAPDPTFAEGEESTPLVAQSIETGDTRELGTAFGLLRGAGTADWVDDIGVVTGWSDLTEYIEFLTIGRDVAGFVNPTDDLAYNMPPRVVAGALSPDGSTLYWAEGPDWGYVAEENTSRFIETGWVIRGVDLLSGEERLAQSIDEQMAGLDSGTVANLHVTDQHVIVNRVAHGDPVAVFGLRLPALVIEVATPEPLVWELPVAGIAAPIGG